MLARMIRILMILVLILVVLSCALNHEKKVFKYFQLGWSPIIENVAYSNKKALNNLIIEMKGGYGDINILCTPFTPTEYEEYLSEISKVSKIARTLEPIELEISGRKLKAAKRTINQNECSIVCSDYYEGIAFSISYFGSCNISGGLVPILRSIKYHFSKETVDEARNDFLGIMNSIEKMNVPAYGKDSDIQYEYSLTGFTKRITYRVDTQPYSVNILNFYRQFFEAHGWKPYKVGQTGDWVENRLFFTWVDRTGEILAKLLVLSEPNAKDAKLAPQTVLIDVTPNLVMEWGRKKGK